MWRSMVNSVGSSKVFARSVNFVVLSRVVNSTNSLSEIVLVTAVIAMGALYTRYGKSNGCGVVISAWIVPLRDTSVATRPFCVVPPSNQNVTIF